MLWRKLMENPDFKLPRPSDAISPYEMPRIGSAEFDFWIKEMFIYKLHYIGATEFIKWTQLTIKQHHKAAEYFVEPHVLIKNRENKWKGVEVKHSISEFALKLANDKRIVIEQCIKAAIGDLVIECFETYGVDSKISKEILYKCHNDYIREASKYGPMAFISPQEIVKIFKPYFDLYNNEIEENQ